MAGSRPRSQHLALRRRCRRFFLALPPQGAAPHLPLPPVRASFPHIAMNPLAVILALSAVAGADDILPQALPKDRYTETLGKSPFVLETKSTDAPTVEKVNPFQSLYLRGISTEAGKDYILIQRLGEERPMLFTGNEPGPDELAVQSVRNGNTFRETKVVLKKGTETGEIGFKEDTLNAPPPAAPGAARGPGMPGQFPKPGPSNVLPQMQAIRPPLPGAIPQPVPRPQGAVPQPINIPQIPGTPQTRLRSGGGGRVINN